MINKSLKLYEKLSLTNVSFNNNFIEPNFSYFDNFMNSNTIIPLNNLSTKLELYLA